MDNDSGKSFFLRNNREKRIFKRISSRISGEGASVHLEFAFAFPLLIGISLFIVEMCMFWDTTVMANHAAFSVARIAKVHCYQGNDPDTMYPEVQVGGKTYTADQVATSFFMMSSTYAWMDSSSSGSTVDFKSYFLISKPLFEITPGADANFFQKILAQILQAIIKPVEQKIRDFLNGQLKTLLDKIFGTYSSQMNQRFNMALQRATKTGTIVTEKIPIPGKLKFPSDDYDTNAWSNPEIIKVSINYPLHKGGWLYSAFMFWAVASDKKIDTVTATGRFAMLVEPEKKLLENYFANDDGTANIDPEAMRKRAREKAKKIIAEASDLIDEWEQAVLAREKIETAYGGRQQAAGKPDYVEAVTTEANLWAKIQGKCNDYMRILEMDPRKVVGLCGDKGDEAAYCKTWFFKCWNWGCRDPTDFTTCARAESANLKYCEKVSNRIAKISRAHDLFASDGKFPHYVPIDTAYPNHSHDHCSKQYFCNSP
ncbi:MAG TPA: hypothetical protein DCZ94_08150 [Lentisphaeria bacterium]|nr:MAG: hypothetical protein A2X48_19625 [Lentisphaerae bacterium GWF2_49_21]HBC86910.1 hypothetical protein [Lentisphaeria bacterium]